MTPADVTRDDINFARNALTAHGQMLLTLSREEKLVTEIVACANVNLRPQRITPTTMAQFADVRNRVMHLMEAAGS